MQRPRAGKTIVLLNMRGGFWGGEYIYIYRYIYIHIFANMENSENIMGLDLQIDLYTNMYMPGKL